MIPDFSGVEQRLERRRAEPAESLRQRVLRAVEEELAADREQNDRITLGFASSIAASLLVGCALAHMAASMMPRNLPARRGDEQAAKALAAITTLDPDLPPGEAPRMALVLSSADNLFGLPQPRLASPFTPLLRDEAGAGDTVE